jgi:tRNA modification GTPase
VNVATIAKTKSLLPLNLDDNSTICALSTPPGVGGIAVVRVSGPDAYKFTRALCPFLPEKPESHRVYFGTAKEVESKAQVDEVVVTCFAEGHSFTLRQFYES